MGVASSRRASAADPEAIAALPLPQYEEAFWMASCRPCAKMSAFAEKPLLFQPDCRLFCPKGPGCKLLSKPAHRELFIHTTRDVVLAAAQRDLESRNPPTKVENGTNEEVALPYVPICWSLDASSAMDTSKLPGALAGRTVVVWIHGFRQKYFRVIGTGSHVLHQLRQAGSTDSSLNLAVLSFLWPCHKKLAAYMRARTDADQAALHFHSVLQALRSLKCRVIVVGHSLGCRVALRALSQAPAAGQDAMCAHLMLLGAALPVDVLSNTGEFPRCHVAAEQVTVLSSTNDDVLRSSFSVGEAMSGLSEGKLRVPAALGLTGPSTQLPSDCRWEDVSSTVPAHNPNLWLMSQDVQRHLVAAVHGVSCPEPNAAAGAVMPASNADGATEDAWSTLQNDDDYEVEISLEDEDDIETI